MENASKALLMAGGVLLAILVLSVGMYLFRQMGASSSNIYSKLEESDITEFNQQFLNYDGRGAGNNPLNIQDVVTIIHIAKDNNESKKMPVTVVIKLNGTPVQEKSEDDIYKMLKDDLTGVKQEYSCQVEKYESELVKEVKIEAIAP